MSTAAAASGYASVDRATQLPTYLGIGLFLLLLLYHFTPLHWPRLDAWQQQELFRRYTGLALLIYLALQWWLTLVRITPRLGRLHAPLLQLHRWVGALTPVFFLLHCPTLGYGFLAVLSISLLANFVLGLLNVRALRAAHPGWYLAWFITHAGASVLITALALLHAWIVFYYK